MNVVRATGNKGIRWPTPAEEIQHGINTLADQIACLFRDAAAENSGNQYNACDRAKPRCHHRRTRRKRSKTNGAFDHTADDIGEQRAVDERVLITGS